MTQVAILPIPLENGAVAYRAVAGNKHSEGATIGQAIDALSAQLSADEAGALVIVQSFQPDRFFTAEQQRRLGELMDRWRKARDAGKELPADELAELHALVDAELRGAAARSAALADAAGL
jgi:hypothetical protein